MKTPSFSLEDAVIVLRRRPPIYLFSGLWVAALAFYLDRPLSDDVAWYLIATEKFAHGGRLYTDVIEVNPPLAFYLTVPAGLLTQAISISASDAFVIYVLVLCGVSLGLLDRVLRRSPALTPIYRIAVMLAAFGALVALPLTEIGQREHLAVVFGLPYIVTASIRLGGARPSLALSTTVGVFGFLGFGLKPYFLIVPFALEVYNAIALKRGRRWRPSAEFMSLAALHVLYAAFIFGSHREYIDFIAPTALLVYDAYEIPLIDAFRNAPVAWLLTAAAVHVAVRFSGRGHLGDDAFVVAMAGFLLAYGVQQKGWPYHLLPAIMVAVVALAAAFARILVSRREPHGGSANLLLGCTVISLCLLLVAPIRAGASGNPWTERFLPFVRQLPADSSILALSVNLEMGFPLVNEARLDWASRFASPWMFPGALLKLERPADFDDKTVERLLELRRYAIKAYVDDFEKFRPALVIVDGYAYPVFNHRQLPYLQLFAEDARFPAIWRNYIEVGRVGEVRVWCRFDVEDRCRP